jgi:hypothetical protein
VKLDFIDQINEYGDSMVRLYDFDMAEAKLFRDALQATLIAKQESLYTDSLGFLKTRNCNLVLRIAAENIGIVRVGKEHFFCDLTLAEYENILELIAPFCTRETKGYQWLYDIDSQIDFLFSPAGTW